MVVESPAQVALEDVTEPRAGTVRGTGVPAAEFADEHDGLAPFTDDPVIVARYDVSARDKLQPSWQSVSHDVPQFVSPDYETPPFFLDDGTATAFVDATDADRVELSDDAEHDLIEVEASADPPARVQQFIEETRLFAGSDDGLVGEHRRYEQWYLPPETEIAVYGEIHPLRPDSGADVPLDESERQALRDRGVTHYVHKGGARRQVLTDDSVEAALSTDLRAARLAVAAGVAVLLIGLALIAASLL